VIGAGRVKTIAGSVVDLALGALIAVSFATVGFPSRTAVAEDSVGAVKQSLQQMVEVRDVRTQPDQVSGVLVNLSSKAVRGVRLRIDRSWLWADERHAGGAEESPGRTAVYTVPGEIPPGGRVPFTYRSDTPLPQRSDGRFETSVSVIELEQVG
jgi:hypothetical protein